MIKNITRRKRNISKEEIKRKVRIISQANNIYRLQDIVKVRGKTSVDASNNFS